MILTNETIKKLLPSRKKNANKGDFGKVAIVGGCTEFAGAPYLATKAALKSGAGYTTLFVPEGLVGAYLLKAPEATLEKISDGTSLSFCEQYFEKLLNYDAIAFGMGAKNTADTLSAVTYLLETYEGKLLLDADALNALSTLAGGKKRTLFSRKKCDVLLTPHIKEFSRLTGKTVKALTENGLAAATAFAWDHFGVTVLLKGAATYITDGKREAENQTGTPAQAKGGSGDLLSGLCAGLMATGLDCFSAGCVGSFLAGRAAELAVETTGEYSLLASDVIDKLGAAFLSVQA